jgi:hypothetical protein
MPATGDSNSDCDHLSTHRTYAVHAPEEGYSRSLPRRLRGQHSHRLGEKIGADAKRATTTPVRQITLSGAGTAHAVLGVADARNFPAALQPSRLFG